MIHWIVPALIAPFINAIVNFVDKYLISKRVRNYWAMPVYSAAVNFFLGTAAWFFAGFPTIAGRDALFALASGFSLALATALYFALLSREETSAAIVLFGLVPVFVLVAAYFLLAERITLGQYSGFFLLLLAAFLVSWKPAAKQNISVPTVGLALAVDFFLAGSVILINLAMRATSFVNILSYQGWGSGLTALALYLGFPAIRKAVRNNWTMVKKQDFGLIFANESLTVLYEWIGYFAYSIGPAALVSVVGGTQAFYGILIGVVLTLAVSNIIKEDISRANLFKKSIAAAILLVGLYFVYT